MLIEKGEGLLGIKLLLENAIKFPLLSIYRDKHRTLKGEADILIEREYNANRLREDDILFLRN